MQVFYRRKFFIVIGVRKVIFQEIFFQGLWWQGGCFTGDGFCRDSRVIGRCVLDLFVYRRLQRRRQNFLQRCFVYVVLEVRIDVVEKMFLCVIIEIFRDFFQIQFQDRQSTEVIFDIYGCFRKYILVQRFKRFSKCFIKDILQR